MMTKWVFVLWIGVAAMPALGQTRPQDRFTLDAAKIAKTLTERGLALAGAQVSLAARVVATEPDPALDVLSVSRAYERHSTDGSELETWVRLGCHVAGKCLPFYAVVSGAAKGGTNSVIGNIAPPQDRAVAIPAGTHTTLMLDDNRAHIQVTVVSLEDGVAGHRIRVASLDRKHIYVAEVVSAQLLKGSF